MKLILHGTDIVNSRNELNSLRQSHQGEIIILNGKTLNLIDLKQSLESGSLFKEDRLVIIENLHNLISKTKLSQLVDYLVTNGFSTKIILWEDKELTKVMLSKFKNWQIKIFKIPKLMFAFLESITPNNQKKIFIILDNLRKNTSNEFIYLMLVRQIRLLILVLDNGITKMPSWMIAKFRNQANKFTNIQLLDLYKKLLLIDIGQKTGKSAFNLAAEVDLFLAYI